MTDRNDKIDSSSSESGDQTVTYTQIASCAVPGHTSEPMRMSLRARLEREQAEREFERKNSLGYRLRSLFNLAAS